MSWTAIVKSYEDECQRRIERGERVSDSERGRDRMVRSTAGRIAGYLLGGPLGGAVGAEVGKKASDLHCDGINNAIDKK